METSTLFRMLAFCLMCAVTAGWEKGLSSAAFEVEGVRIENASLPPALVKKIWGANGASWPSSSPSWTWSTTTTSTSAAATTRVAIAFTVSKIYLQIIYKMFGHVCFSLVILLKMWLKPFYGLNFQSLLQMMLNLY